MRTLLKIISDALVNIANKSYNRGTVEIKGNEGARESEVYHNGRHVDTIITKEINVAVTGNVHSISNVNGDIEVIGDVSGNTSTVNGDITVYKQVKGSVSTVNGDVIINKGAINGV